LNRLVPNGMPGGVRGGRNFPLLDLDVTGEERKDDYQCQQAFRHPLLLFGMVFDPILKNEQFSAGWIAEQCGRLCEQLHDFTERCIISFVDEYAHTRNRTDVLNRSEMLETAGMIADISGEYRLPGFSCAEEIDLSGVGIEHSSCIDQRKVEQLIGARITTKKDTGQRPACGCIESVDLGAYDTCRTRSHRC